MTHLLDTSALLAHYFAESGAEDVQALFEDDAAVVGVSVLTLFEFESRLLQLGMDAAKRTEELLRYRSLLDEVVDVDEKVRFAAIRLREKSTARISAMDVLIAATAAFKGATLVHRDPHFAAIPDGALIQHVLPAK